MVERLPRIDPGISYGHLLTIIPTVLLGFYVLGSQAMKTDTNQESVKYLQASITATEVKLTAQIIQAKAEMASKIIDVQTQTNEQSRVIRADIANLPDVRATMTQLERRSDQTDARAGAQSSRLDLNQQAVASLSAKLDALKEDVVRLSNVIQGMQRIK